MNATVHITILKKLEGTFPCDLAAKGWRIFFIVFGWIVLPCAAIGSILENFPPTAAISCVAVGISALGLATGYVSWISKNHHIRFEDGEIKSIGRKTLWQLRLEDIESIRVYRSGDFVIWWLKTHKTEKGLRIYPSLKTAIQKIIEQSDPLNPLDPSACGDR